MNQNQVTFKIKYNCEVSLHDYVLQYNNVLRYTYNRIIENPSMRTKDITACQHRLNNCELVGSHLRNSAIHDARALIASNRNKLIFGGKSNFLLRCKGKIDKQTFLNNRLMSLYSIGIASEHSNRLFRISSNNTIIFQPDRYHHFTLELCSIGKKRINDLRKLKLFQDNNQTAITYRLDSEYVYLTFDYNILRTYEYKVVQNRVFAIDMNPNSIGWSVVDWHSDSNYSLVQSGTISLKPLNDYRDSKKVSSSSNFHKYITNKRKHEIIEIAKQLFSLCRYYHCEIFSIENMNISHQDNKLGKRFNRLVNNMWNRNLLINQLRKHVNCSSTTLVECEPQYNSYIGNLIFRQERLPDECLASIEIGRRGFEFVTQYIFNRRPHKKTVVFPDLKLVKNQLALSLEELGIDVSDFDDWKTILSAVKESKKKYRFSTSEAQVCHSEGLFSKFYKRRYTIVNIYI